MKLSVIIPNRNDTVMLGITVRSALEELKAIDNDGEIVIVDNSDIDLWTIIKTVNISPLNLGYVEEGRVRLIRQDFPSIYSARQTAIENAKGEYVYNMDSHTIVGRNQFKDLVSFMDGRKNGKVGFGFAPIGWVNQHETYARHDIRTDEGTIFGSWGRQYYEPTKICWNFGSCICNREWFLNVHGGYDFFASKRVSWGGGEFYVPIKGWLLGWESWAIPCAPQYHIGPHSKEIESRTPYRYRLYGDGGNGRTGVGILAAFYALGGEDGKEELLKVPRVFEQYGLDIDRDWPKAISLAREAREDIEKRQVVSFKDFLKIRPWYERWDDWKPYETIQKNFNLAML